MIIHIMKICKYFRWKIKISKFFHIKNKKGYIKIQVLNVGLNFFLYNFI
ncbi:hypothetical protein HMPREF0628_0968 [Peptoniphilus lacrimalis 315-B]|uniref:Uncharacterized protein n=1 Tax=Peptoniphilus lacrimalis 315-B TaxID=596330 RepID=D1VW03_9FIRM|nr:hypothetical protein HMPREF0628_0968 [Peptoniphilus lacrimalis 315-B]